MHRIQCRERADHAGGRSFARCIGYVPGVRFVTLRDRHAGGQPGVVCQRVQVHPVQFFGTNYVARATPSSPANAANGQTWIMDCASGDTHGLFGFYNGQGALHVGYRRLCHRWRGAAVLENRDNLRERARSAHSARRGFHCTTRRRQASRPTSTFSATIARLRTRIRKYGPSSQRRLPGQARSARSTATQERFCLRAQTRRRAASVRATGPARAAQTGTVNAIPGQRSHRRRMERSWGGFAWPWHRRRFGLIRKSRPDDCVLSRLCWRSLGTGR